MYQIYNKIKTKITLFGHLLRHSKAVIDTFLPGFTRKLMVLALG